MPRRTDQYLADRRTQILDAARRCFLRDGFHATSMQDLFAESGLSAGAVYRYFRSKNEMILAIAEENMRDVAALVHAVGRDSHESFGEALADVVKIVQARHDETQIGALAVQVWAESSRDPQLRARFAEIVEENRASIVDVVRAHQVRGNLPADVDTVALANVFSALVPGYLLQLSLIGPAAVDGVVEAVRVLWPAVPAGTDSPRG